MKAKTSIDKSTKNAAKSRPGEASTPQDKASTHDAATLLKADHRQVEEMFERYQDASDTQQKREIATQVCNALIVHTLLEEEIFYPACRQKGVEDDVLDEAQVEHDGAKVMITELLLEQPQSDYFDAKVAVLTEYIKHHVREEEKSDGIFAKAKQAGVDMEGLGERLASRKQQLTTEIEAHAPQPPSFRSLHCIDNTKEEDTMNRGSNYRERDEEGRFTSDDDRRGSGRSRGSSYRERDEDGRFTSGDDRRGSGRYGRSRYEDDDDDRRGGRGGSGHGGWFGDSEGHSEASRRGWEQGHEGGSRSSGYSSRSRYDDEDDRFRRSAGAGGGGRGRYEEDDDGRRGGRGGQGGWFGDSEGHSEASRRGWERGDHGPSGWYGDSAGHSEASRRGWERGDHGPSGWYGDSAGHSEASRRGWEHGHDNGGRSSGYSSRGRYEDNDDRSRGGSSRGGRGHGGWFGDSEGHSQASRRGWRDRD